MHAPFPRQEVRTQTQRACAFCSRRVAKDSPPTSLLSTSPFSAARLVRCAPRHRRGPVSMAGVGLAVEMVSLLSRGTAAAAFAAQGVGIVLLIRAIEYHLQGAVASKSRGGPRVTKWKTVVRGKGRRP